MNALDRLHDALDAAIERVEITEEEARFEMRAAEDEAVFDLIQEFRA